MSQFQSLALLQAHALIPSVMNYLVSDLTELCALAASVSDVVDDIAIPVGPTDRAPLEAFHDFMKRRRPELVGISAYTCTVKSGLRYAEIAKRYGATVVMGGYHPSAMPEQLLDSPFVDVVVRGEGELTLRDLILHGPSRDVPGLVFKEGGEVVFTGERELIRDLDALPLPRRELRPPRFGLDGLNYHVDSVYTSRGCTAKCTFCANHLVGKRWRKRSVESVIEELISIAPATGKKPKLVKLWDPNFLTHAPRVAELCDQIIAHGLHHRFRFMAETRIEDIVRGRDVLKKMAEAGFYHLGTGVESPSEETLKTLNKGKNSGPEAVRTAVQAVADSGMALAKFFIIGHPRESVEDILDYADFAVSPGIRQQASHFFILTPYPGTGTFDQYDAAGWITNKDWDLYSNYTAVIEANGIPPADLQALSGALALQSSMLKRFARGEPFSTIAGKLLALTLAFCKVVQTQSSWSETTRENSVWEMVSRLRGAPARPRESDRGTRWFHPNALRFHRAGRAPIVVGLEIDGGEEKISVRCEKGERRTPAPGLTLNVSLDHLMRLARAIDARKTPHDAITLIFNPRAMRLRWLGSLAGQAARTALLLAAMGLFHLGSAVKR